MDQLVFLTNWQLENLTAKEKLQYFTSLREWCLKNKKNKKRNAFHEIITKIYPNIRNYDYEIMGMENIPNDRKGVFVCNHSNSHDFFTAHEIFKKLGTNVSVFAASDDIGPVTRTLFDSCDAVLIDRNDKNSIKKGILDFSTNLISGLPGVIFGEGTWNLHPYKPMQQIKVGSSKIAAITNLPIIPTIFEYVESPKKCSKESELYTNCIIRFGTPIYISEEYSLLDQTTKIQSSLEQNRIDLWKKLGIQKSSIFDVDPDMYLNHTYLKKFGALGFTYDSLSESRYLFSEKGQSVENEFCINKRGDFVPGITKKEEGKKYIKVKR